MGALDSWMGKEAGEQMRCLKEEWQEICSNEVFLNTASDQCKGPGV